MAVEKITFELGSNFSGEGFEKANKLIEKNRKELEGGKRGVGELTQAFRELDPNLAKATGNVGKFADAFIQGGIVGGLITAAMMGVAEGVKLIYEKLAEARQAAKNLANELMNKLVGATKTNTEAFEDFRNEVAKTRTEAEGLLAVMNATIAEKAKRDVMQLNMEKLQAVADEITAEGKALVAAEYDLKIAMIQNKAANEASYNTLQNATKAVKDATEVRVESENLLADQRQQLRIAEGRLVEYTHKREKIEAGLAKCLTDYEAGHLDYSQMLKNRVRLQQDLKELEEVYKERIAAHSKVKEAVVAAEKNLEAAVAAEAKAKNAATIAQEKFTTDQKKLTTDFENLNVKLKEAKEAEIAATEKAAEKKEKEARSWEEHLEKLKKKLPVRDADFHDEVLRDLMAGEDGVKKGGDPKEPQKVKVVNEKPLNVGMNANLWPNEMKEIPKPKKLDQKVWDRWKNGTATLAERERVKRFMEMDRRYNMSQMKRLLPDFTKFVQNADKPESWLSKHDKQQMETMKREVIPSLGVEVATKLLKDAGSHVLCSDDMKPFIEDEKAIRKYVESLIKKTAVEDAVKTQTKVVEAALTVR
jgi:hypothetical protein